MIDKRARVTQLYNLLRTARLNVLYYERSLKKWTRLIRSHDLLVAITSASSSLAFLKRSTEPVSTQAWFYLTVAAGCLGMLKPVLRLDKQVSLHSELVTHYRELYHDLKCIADDVEGQKDFAPAMEKNFLKCREREGDLQKKEPPPDERKVRRLQRVVEVEINVHERWYPE